MSSLLFQLGISGPLVLAVIVYIATQREQGLVQRYLLGLLVLILAWMVGMVAQTSPDPRLRLAGDWLTYPPAAFMAPVFCLLMLLYARVELFEARRGVRWAVLAPFWVFLLLFLTNGWHGQMGGALPAPGAPRTPPGPLFWSFQVCSNAAALVGLGISVHIARRTPSAEERRRMLLLCAGAFLPLVVHLSYTFEILPFDYPLTSASLGVTSLLMVAAIRRYRLLEVQPVARRDVIEASGDAVIVADADECVVDLNPTAASCLGMTRNAVCGRRLSEVLAELEPTKPAGVLEAMLGTIRRGDTPAVLEIEDPDGRIFEVSGGTARGGTGVTAGYFVVLRDRTTERRAERLLHRSQRLESVGILAAGVAHEVNNPLAFVRANLVHLGQIASLLESRVEDLPKEIAEETRDLSEVIDESTTGLERIERIVRGLLGLSRSTSDRIGPCDANEIVNEAVRFASLDGDATVQIEMNLAHGLPDLEASSDQLVQALLNLFLNARQALRQRPDARIVASTRACGAWVEVRVEDDGPGVPEAIRSRIFDPFFTTREPNEGTGLGLPIAFDIVRRHGGTIEVETSDSGGACFVVRLPARVSSERTASIG